MKRLLSWILTIVMVFSLLPTSAMAADSTYEIGATATTPNKVPPAEQDGCVWELTKTEGPDRLVGYSSVCGKNDHTHTETCFTQTCDHTNGHTASCYPTSTSYNLCTCEADGKTHDGEATITNVASVELKLGFIPTGIKWDTAHPAYSAVYGEYTKRINGSTSIATQGEVLLGLLKEKFCYSISTGDTPTCGHTCSEVGGSCYSRNTVLCWFDVHTHQETDDVATSCYRYTWTLKCQHTYTGVVTAPTCTEVGYTTYTCPDCGDTYVADEVAALGHTEEILAGKDATCIETGLTEGKKCSVCKEIILEQQTIPATGHPDEDTNYICDTCGEKLCTEHTEEILADKAATCTEAGMTEGKKCSICGEVLVAQEEIPAKGHAFVYTQIDSTKHEATCKCGETVTHIHGQNTECPFCAEAPAFGLKENATLIFYQGFELPDHEELFNAVIADPSYAEAKDVTVQYLARTEGEYQVDVSAIGDALADISIIGSWLKSQFDNLTDGGKITITLGEKWLDVATEIDEGDLQAVIDATVQGMIDKVKSGDYTEALADLSALSERITNAAGTIGCREFGEITDAAVLDADGNVVETLWVSCTKDGVALESKTITVTLLDDRTAVTIDGNDASLIYQDYATESEVFAAINPTLIDANGKVVAGEIVQVEKLVGKTVGEYTVTLKYAGSETHKPSQATYTVTVVQASAKLDLPNVNIVYGDEYSPIDEATVTLGNAYGEKSEITDSLIQFLIGLDVSELDVNEDGIHGLTGKVQLILPAELQSLLDSLLGLTGGDTSEGMSMTLSQLNQYLDTLNDSSLSILNQALDAIRNVTESGDDFAITLGGAYPTNVGAYLYGAVSTNSNYETAYDVAYIVIQPKATQVYLDWNNYDENSVYTWELLKNFDFEASAYNDEALTDKNDSASEVTHELIFGINDQGEFVIELDKITTNGKDLGIGAFVEVAFTVDFGNYFYYAVPIVRPIVIVPSYCTVEIAGTNEQGVILNQFDNTSKDVTVNVYGTSEDGVLTVTYIGMQTNGVEYNSTVAPAHAGAYLVTATYYAKNDNGALVEGGLDVAVLVIEPAASTIEVKDAIVEMNGNLNYFEDQVTAGSAVAGLKPDVTIISAGIKADGNFSEEGWSAVEGNVNVNFPAWFDKILKEYVPSVADGMTASELKDKLNNKLPDISAELMEAGATDKVVNAMANMIGEINKILAEIPDNATLTFYDDAACKDVGLYLVIGVVTDSDHYPSVDAGVLVIAACEAPDVPDVPDEPDVPVEPEHKHSYEAVVTAPTCEKAGYTTYTCACGDSYVADETAALGHTPAEAVKENEVAATCSADGSYDSVVYCSVESCKAELSREKIITVPALGHVDENNDGRCDYCPIIINNNGNGEHQATYTFTEEVTEEGEIKKTVTVTHENACTVVVQNPDGTYARVEAAKNDDGSYSFDVSDKLPEGASVVIAEKGDINLDNQLDISDILACVYGFTSSGSDGNELDGLETLIADTNNDNVIDISDILALVYAFTGTPLNW